MTRRTQRYVAAVAAAAALACATPSHAQHGHDHGAVAEDPNKLTESKRIAELTRQFIDAYVAWAPSTGTYLGLHDCDSLLEDRSRRSIEAWEKELASYRRALEPQIERGIDSLHLFELNAFRHIIGKELFEVGEIRAWQKNPMYYNDILSNSLYELAAKRFAPAEARLRCVIARERQFPRLVAQAKENLDNPPELYTRQAIELASGTIAFLDADLPKFADEVTDAGLRAEFAAENARAVAAVRDFVAFLEKDLLPRSKGEHALGREIYAKLLLHGGGYDVDPTQILKIGERELDRTFDAFQRTAKQVPGKGGAEKKAAALAATHPPSDSLVGATAQLLDELRAFLIENEIVTPASEERCRVVPMLPFMWGFAAMNTPGPFESLATDAYYYVKNVEDSWSPEKKEEHLRSFSPWNLALISIHEAYPGHFVQGLAAHGIPAPIRKLSNDYAYAEGWAHYAEQMMVDEGYGGDDPRFRLAQQQEALKRLCRLVVSIRMHTKGMTIEEATRLFEKKAFMERFPAEREAERGAFDPGYLNYTLGKLAILKLRDDWKTKVGDAYSLRGFHDEFLSYGAIPIPLVRHAMLGPLAGPPF